MRGPRGLRAPVTRPSALAHLPRRPACPATLSRLGLGSPGPPQPREARGGGGLSLLGTPPRLLSFSPPQLAGPHQSIRAHAALGGGKSGALFIQGGRWTEMVRGSTDPGRWAGASLDPPGSGGTVTSRDRSHHTRGLGDPRGSLPPTEGI